MVLSAGDTAEAIVDDDERARGEADNSAVVLMAGDEEDGAGGDWDGDFDLDLDFVVVVVVVDVVEAEEEEEECEGVDFLTGLRLVLAKTGMVPPLRLARPNPAADGPKSASAKLAIHSMVRSSID